MKRTLAFLLALFAVCAQAGIRNYVASIDHSKWQMEESTPLQCVLTHNIPRYGKAVFVSRASRKLNLNFTLEMKRKPDETTPVSVRSVAPSWRPGVPARNVGELQYFSHFNGELERQEAWLMLTELEQGMQPTFFYQDWYGPDQVAVGLSAVNFAPKYGEFMSCLDTLLPYGFEDIAFSVLHYEEKDGELTRDSQQRLEQIAQYLALDPTIELLLIDTHTDSYSSEQTNMAITRKQANDLKSYFVGLGIPEQRILSEAHGEKRHIAKNTTENSRALNRRVMVRMELN